MKYYKANWEEARGDNFDNWGASTWYFEIDDNDYVVRQIESYKNGNSLKYQEGKKLEDNYGMLSDQPIDKSLILENSFKEISNEEFEKTWQTSGKIDGKQQWVQNT